MCSMLTLGKIYPNVTVLLFISLSLIFIVQFNRDFPPLIFLRIFHVKSIAIVKYQLNKNSVGEIFFVCRRLRWIEV